MAYVSEEQRAVVESDARFIALNGCAGSYKTSTLIKIIERALVDRRNVLVLTLVGSVTSEIKDRIEALPDAGIQFEKRGSHFLAVTASGTSVEIANIDAFVHKQLAVHHDPFLLNYGDCHEQKSRLLLDTYVDRGRHKVFVMCNNAYADLVVIDEFQDLQPTKVQILTGIARVDDEVRAVAAGDVLQSIFDHALESDAAHPLIAWQDQLGATKFCLSKCFRCPSSHVAFVNNLLELNKVERWATPSMTAVVKDEGAYAPFLMTCPDSNSNVGASRVADQVMAALEALMSRDTQIKPQDVAFIAPRTNNNPVFRQLEPRLARLYGGGEHVKLFETRRDGNVVPISWDRAQGRSVMLSIHGCKGKGFRAVFFVGFGEGAVPAKTRVNTSTELVDLSLMNVALTRSTRWLFVCFPASLPSRYLREYIGQTDPANAVLGWKPTTWSTDTQKAVMHAVNAVYPEGASSIPVFDPKFYFDYAAIGPAKLLLEVKNDLSMLVEHPRQLTPSYNWVPTAKVEFGTPSLAISGMCDERLPTYGMMGELLLQRAYYEAHNAMSFLPADLAGLLVAGKVVWVKDDKLLDAVHDAMLNVRARCEVSYDAFVCCINAAMKRLIDAHETLAPGILNGLREIQVAAAVARGPVYVLPAFLGQCGALEDLRAFADRTVSTQDIRSSVAWNVALIARVLYDRVRSPVLLGRQFGTFDSDVTPLLDNIRAFLRHLGPAEPLKFNCAHKIIGIETDREVLQSMGIGYQSKASYGIVGISDAESPNATYEFKTTEPGTQPKYSNAWTLQTLLYHILRKDTLPTSTINVVDLSGGVMTVFGSMGRINKRAIVRELLARSNFLEDHVRVLLSQLRF